VFTKTEISQRGYMILSRELPIRPDPAVEHAEHHFDISTLNVKFKSTRLQGSQAQIAHRSVDLGS
jgi:hypothetical protein